MLHRLETETSTLNKCFEFNHFQSNSDKNKLLVTLDKTVSVKIDKKMIKSTTTVKVLGITIYSKLSLQKHVKKMYDRYTL